MPFFSSLRHKLQLLRSPERNIIAAIVDDPLKVQREVRFLLLRLAVFIIIAIALVTASVLFIRRGVAHIEEQRALQGQVYTKFESMARLSHDVTEGRAALEKMQSLFPKDDNLLPFLKALEELAKQTENKATFRFEGAPTPVPDMPPYRFITYAITLEGDTRSLLRYLSAFDALPYLVTLDGFTITGDHGIAEPKATVQIKGKLYVQ